MSQVTVTLVFASIAEAATTLANMGKPTPAAVVTVADSKPTAAVVQRPAAAPETKVETVKPQASVAVEQAVDPAALEIALQNFAKRDNAAFSALMKQHGMKNMPAVKEAKHLHAALMAAATNA